MGNIFNACYMMFKEINDERDKKPKIAKFYAASRNGDLR